MEATIYFYIYEEGFKKHPRYTGGQAIKVPRSA